jgi:hypothetical protein
MEKNRRTQSLGGFFIETSQSNLYPWFNCTIYTAKKSFGIAGSLGVAVVD